MTTETRDLTEHAARAAEADAFAQRVRQYLSDLPTEEISELTDGLVADLIDRIEEGGTLDEPERYASEMRQAAGLPPRMKTQHRQPLRVELAETATRVTSWWKRSPRRIAISDFLGSLRPVWWVLRGIVLANTVWVVFFGRLGAVQLLLSLAAVIVSVQWGRGKWLPNALLRAVKRVASVLAILLIPFQYALIGNTFAGPVSVDDTSLPYPLHEGIWLNDEEISNIFVYDCAGNPLDAVQLYTQDGQPLSVTTYGWEHRYFYTPSAGEQALVRNPLAQLPSAWNVFPLAVAEELDEERQPSPDDVKPATPPFAQVPALSQECPTGETRSAVQSETPQSGAPVQETLGAGAGTPEQKPDGSDGP